MSHWTPLPPLWLGRDILSTVRAVARESAGHRAPGPLLAAPGVTQAREGPGLAGLNPGAVPGGLSEAQVGPGEGASLTLDLPDQCPHPTLLPPNS